MSRRQLPKTHDRAAPLRERIEKYRSEYRNHLHYSVAEECKNEIEILHEGDVPEDVLIAVETIQNDAAMAVFLDIATIINNHPRIPKSHILRALDINNGTYYTITKNPIIGEYLTSLRRTVLEDDVIEAALILRRLMRDADPRVAFGAVKFILENNGQMYGYGIKEDNTKAGIKIIVEDKRTNSTLYSEEDLKDV